jgi:hypothetical protein
VEISMIKESIEKKVYRGIFNYHGDIFTKYVKAHNEDQAFRIICKLISEGMGLKNDIDIRHYFWGTDYFDIKEVINNELKDSEVSTYKERV